MRLSIFQIFAMPPSRFRLRFSSMSRRSAVNKLLSAVCDPIQLPSDCERAHIGCHLSCLRMAHCFAQIKNRLSFRTSGSIVSICCDRSVHSRACTNTPGSRYPLDPASKRHTLLSHSAFSAAGIMVPWRSFGRYVLRELNICICSISFPFRTCGSIFSDFHYNTI